PGLLLVVFAAFLRPSGTSFEFLVQQGDVVVGLLRHFAVLATAYTSLVLLVSACVRRRLTAIVLSVLAFLGGGLVAAAAHGVEGPLGDVARACSLYDDAYRVLRDALGTGLPWT